MKDKERIERLEKQVETLDKQIDFMQDWIQEHKHTLTGKAYCKIKKQIWDW